MHIVVFRFSAMGDVALCLPVLKSLLALNPQLRITLVTRKNFAFLFKEVERLQVVAADLAGAHKGLSGLYKLSQKIKKMGHIDYVCDLHQVLRTHVLNLFFGLKVLKMNKGRSEKKNFIQNKTLKPLKHTTERYLDVFRTLPLKLPSSMAELVQFGFSPDEVTPKLDSYLNELSSDKIIGFAPFAKHMSKTWPLDYVENFLALMQKHNTQILLFGGPGEEQKKLELLAGKYQNTKCVAGMFSMTEEMSLMKRLRIMIVMDSANMHFATLCHTPIISIWGGTHPNLGFAPIDTKSEILQVDLACRPCSAFGRGDCPEAHFKCMREITPERLFQLVQSKI